MVLKHHVRFVSVVAFGLLATVLFVFIRSQATVGAQDAQSITLNVSPTVVEIDANPGDTQEGSFKIVNGSDIELELTATPKNFTASDEVGGVDLTVDDTSYSLARWIDVSPQTVVVPARGSFIFDYTISVPDNAEPGGHFGSIIVNTQPVQVDLTGPAVSQEVGPLILVKIAGDTLQEASVVEFATEKSLYETGPVTFSTRINNTGNVHFKPRGAIEIKDTFGKTVTNIDLEEKNVLPDAIRKLSNDWNPNGFTVGRYTADLTLIYGVDDQIITASTTFTVFPYKTMVPVIVILLLLLVSLIRGRARVKKAFSVLKNG